MNRIFAFWMWCGRFWIGLVLGVSTSALVGAAEINEDVQRLYEQGKVYYQQGKFLEATEAFEHALQLSQQQAVTPPEVPTTPKDETEFLERFSQGRDRYRHGDYAGAVEAFERAFTVEPTSENASKWLIKARQALARQEVTEQLRASQEAQRRLKAQRRQTERLEREARKAKERLARQVQASREPVPAAKPKAKAIRANIREYIVNIGDVIEVFVWQQPDLTRNVIVRPDGRVSFPLVGDVDAAGLTLVQLDAIMTERLKTYIRIPDVSLAIQRFGGTKTIVLGEVTSPGVYVPAGEGRALEVVAMAGGFTEDAGRKSVMLLRGGLAAPQIVKLNLDKALRRGAFEQNVVLQPNDIIFVPKGGIASTLEFMERFYPTISEVLIGNQIAEDFGVREVSGGVTR